MTRWLIVVAITLTAGTATAAVPKYQWTPAQASAQIMRWQPNAWANDPLNEVETKTAKCVKATGGFRCTVTGKAWGLLNKPRTEAWWVKVRKQGTGQPCVSNVSLAAIPYGCLNPVGSRVRGDDSDAERAAVAKARQQNPGWQGVNVFCHGYGAGFYTCESSGKKFASVSFSPVKVSVSLTG